GSRPLEAGEAETHRGHHVAAAVVALDQQFATHAARRAEALGTGGKAGRHHSRERDVMIILSRDRDLKLLVGGVEGGSPIRASRLLRAVLRNLSIGKRSL